MRELARQLAKCFGVATSYHVAALYMTGTGQVVMSITCTVKPWLHIGNYGDLVAYVESQSKSPDSAPCITSITRLGV